MNPEADDLTLALALADAADALTMKRFGAVDLDVEAMIRRRLSEARPDDSVFGEEFGGTKEFAGRQWVVDPIDGTKNFVRGVPVWATLIALLRDGVPVLGVVSAPALQRRWRAQDGKGAFAVAGGQPPRRLRVSKVDDLASASLAFSSLSGWAQRGLRERFVALTDEVWRVRGYGDFFNYCLVAEGAVDIAAEPEVSTWDLAPLDVLVREAGGRFTDLAGRPGPHGGSAVATNGLLHDAVLNRLRRA
jgi:histidinol-phosphatase